MEQFEEMHYGGLGHKPELSRASHCEARWNSMAGLVSAGSPQDVVDDFLSRRGEISQQDFSDEDLVSIPETPRL